MIINHPLIGKEKLKELKLLVIGKMEKIKVIELVGINKTMIMLSEIYNFFILALLIK